MIGVCYNSLLWMCMLNLIDLIPPRLGERCSSMIENLLMYDGLSDRSLMVDSLSWFDIYLGIIQMKYPLLLIGKSRPWSGNSKFSLCHSVPQRTSTFAILIYVLQWLSHNQWTELYTSVFCILFQYLIVSNNTIS